MPFFRRFTRQGQADPRSVATEPGERLDRLLADVARQRQARGEVDREVESDAWAHRSELVEGGRWLPGDAGDAADQTPRDGGALTGDEDDDVPLGRHRGVSSTTGRPRLHGLFRVPASLRGADLQVRPAAVLGLVLVLVLVGAILGIRVWLAQVHAEPVPVTPVAPAGDTGLPRAADQVGSTGAPLPSPGAAGGVAGQSAPATPTTVVIHVAGAVVRPGVVTLPVGARVEDAVEAAGGLRRSADTGRVNLARVLGDGERLWVPEPGEEVPTPVDGWQPAVDPAGGPEGGVAGAMPGTSTPLLDLNSADKAALEGLPGVGPVTAERILQWRVEHGRFSSVDELLEVSGIGERTLEELRPHVRV